MTTASPTFDSEMADIRADVASQATVISSAVAVFNSLVGQLAKAEASAVTAGATPAQLAAITQIRVGIESNTVSLASAIHANTDGGPAEEPAPVVDPVTAGLPDAPEGSKPVLPPVPTPSEPTVTTTSGVVEQPAAPEQGASPDQPAT